MTQTGKYVILGEKKIGKNKTIVCSRTMKMNKHTTDREISQILLGSVSIFQIWQSKPII